MRKTALLALLFVGYWANASQHNVITEKNTNAEIRAKHYKPEKLVATASESGRISLWDANTGHMKNSVVIPEGLTVNEVTYNREVNFVVAVCSKTLKDALLFVWNPESDTKNFVALSKTQQAKEIRICEGSTAILVSYPDNSVEYLELPTAKRIFHFDPKTNYTINMQSIAISKDKKLMFAPSTNGGAYVLDINTQTQIKQLEGINAQSAIFSPDGKSLLVITDKNIKIYNTETWEVTEEKALPKLENGTFKPTQRGDKILFQTNGSEQSQNNLAVHKVATSRTHTIAIGFAADGKTLNIDF